jgi:hypothetical protein
VAGFEAVTTRVRPPRATTMSHTDRHSERRAWRGQPLPAGREPAAGPRAG